MAPGATEEDVKKVSQILAHTVRQLEAETTPEPGPRGSQAEDVVTTMSSLLGKTNTWFQQHGHREPGSHQAKPFKRAH